MIKIQTRPVTGRSLRIYRHFNQKGFEILVNKELLGVVTRLKLHKLAKQPKLTKESGLMGQTILLK